VDSDRTFFVGHPIQLTRSTSTRRKTLRGETVPQRWENAEALFLVLCEMAEVDPEDSTDTDPWGNSPTHKEQYRYLWNEALDDTSTGVGFADEPPF
jgi:hypothetical protein